MYVNMFKGTLRQKYLVSAYKCERFDFGGLRRVDDVSSGFFWRGRANENG